MVEEGKMQNAVYEQTVDSGIIRRSTGWRLWIWWVLATALGGALGLIMARVLPYLASYIFHVDVGIGRRFEIVVITEVVPLWATVGMAQWLFLRRYVHKLALWIPATALGVVVFLVALWAAYSTWAWARDLLETLDENYSEKIVPMSLIGSLFGLCLGLLQWLVLARRISNGVWWVLVSALSWAIALVVGGGISEAIIERGRENWYQPLGALEGLVDTGGIKPGILMITIYAAITGFALVWLLQQQLPEREPTRISSETSV
jgi:hypothetical protein